MLLHLNANVEQPERKDLEFKTASGRSIIWVKPELFSGTAAIVIDYSRGNQKICCFHQDSCRGCSRQ